MATGNFQELLQSSLHPDKDKAFEAIYSRYQPYLFGQAYKMLKNSDDAKDVVQRVFIKLWNQQSYRDIESLSAYLNKMCYHECLRHIENRDKRAAVNDELKYTEPVREEAHFAEAFEIKEQLVAAGAALSENQRQVFSLLYLQNYSYREAAHRMGLSVNAIKLYRRLAIKSLKDKLIHLIT